jgi:hypothetical protein
LVKARLQLVRRGGDLFVVDEPDSVVPHLVEFLEASYTKEHTRQSRHIALQDL